MKRLFQLFILFLSLFSCARSYHPIKPSIYNFENIRTVNPELTVSYLYDVQSLNRNKPYARKERKKGIKLIAIKVENHSSDTITLSGKNFKVQTPDGRKVVVLRPEYYAHEIRQSSELFTIFYALGGVGVTFQQNSMGSTEVNYYYNPIPLAIGIGNTIFAGVANTNQKKNLIEYRIFDKKISPNSTIYGLMPLEEYGYPELQFKYEPLIEDAPY